MKVCSVEGCENDVHARGLCRHHYLAAWRAGRDACAVDGCDQPGLSKGLCHAHYSRLRRTGTVGDEPLRAKRTGCIVPGCEGKHQGHGYCLMHWERWHRHGDPMVVKVPEVHQPTGPDNPRWKEAPSYRLVHSRLGRHRGPASAQVCVDCGGPAQHWSYVHGSPNEWLDEATGQLYSPDIDTAYVPRCAADHQAYDRALRRGTLTS